MEMKNGGQAGGTKEELIMEEKTSALKDFGQKVKEFVEENRQMLLVIAGVVAAVATVCVVIKLLCRDK